MSPTLFTKFKECNYKKIISFIKNNCTIIPKNMEEHLQLILNSIALHDKLLSHLNNLVDNLN